MAKIIKKQVSALIEKCDYVREKFLKIHFERFSNTSRANIVTAIDIRGNNFLDYIILRY